VKKYRIKKQISNGLPFILGEFEDFHKCYMYFLKIIKSENEKVSNFSSCGFYVLNDFYKNKFELNANCIKIKIEKRIRKQWKILRLEDI